MQDFPFRILLQVVKGDFCICTSTTPSYFFKSLWFIYSLMEYARLFTRLIGGIARPEMKVSVPVVDPKDEKYARTAATSACIRSLLKKGASLELYLEAKKSRIGKPSTELYGSKKSRLHRFINYLDPS
jgi:hypothetical protein